MSYAKNIRVPASAYVLFGAVCGVAISLGIIEIEIPECDRGAERADWRAMRMITDENEAGILRIIEGLGQ